MGMFLQKKWKIEAFRELPDVVKKTWISWLNLSKITMLLISRQKVIVR